MTKKKRVQIRDIVSANLEKQDLSPWQGACKSLAPPHYSRTTRDKWFNENKFRAKIGREIVSFIENLIVELQEDTHFSDVRTSELRSAIVKGIRYVEKKQGIEQYLLNDVKLAALRTIVSWIDNPEKLKENPSTNRSKRVQKDDRKRAKGKYDPPKLILVKDWEITSNGSICITSTMVNNNLHPFQNVELEINFGQNLTVKKVTPFSWSPKKGMIRIGFIKASLDQNPLDISFTTELTPKKNSSLYKITAKIHFDDCEKGIRAVSSIVRDSFRVT